MSQLIINHAYTIVEGRQLTEALRQLCSYRDSGWWYARRAMAARFGSGNVRWDGRRYLMSRNLIPTGLLLLPRVRELCQQYDTRVVDERTYPPAELKPLKGIELRDYQLEAIDVALRAKRGVVKATTGVGKTILMFGVINSIDGPALWITPSSRDLARQTYDSACECFDSQTVGLIGDGQFTISDVTVALINTLYARRRTPAVMQLLSRACTLVVDECVTGDTNVLLPGGFQLPIRRVVADKSIKKVLSYDYNQNAIVPAVIAARMRVPLTDDYKLKFVVGDHIVELTEHDSLATEHGMTSASVVGVGMRVLALDGPRLTAQPIVQRTKVLRAPGEYVYDLTVEVHHNYFANYVLKSNCHHVSAKRLYTMTMACSAPFRFGCSATPSDRTDNSNVKLVAAIGPTIFDMSMQTAQHKGIVPNVEVYVVPFGEPPTSKDASLDFPELKGSASYRAVYDRYVVHNEQRNQLIAHIASHGGRTLVHVRRRTHGFILERMISQQTTCMFVHGWLTRAKRQRMQEQFENGDIDVLVATNVFALGMHIDPIDTLVIGSADGSWIPTYQKLGRGMHSSRRSIAVFDFADADHAYLKRHSYRRGHTYKALGIANIYKLPTDREELYDTIRRRLTSLRPSKT